MRVWLDGGEDVWLASCGIQQGVIVEEASQIGSFHRWENIFGHVGVESLWVTFQGLKQSKGVTAGFNFLGGKTENEKEKNR